MNITNKFFNIAHTLNCGQVFRFYEENDGSFTLIAAGQVVNISQVNDIITFKNIAQHEFDSVWYRYFQLDVDYSTIYELLAKEPHLAATIEYAHGLRLLRQDYFEVLLSFIISANNNIPRIKLIIERFCAMFGEAVEANGRTYYRFPTPQRLDGIELGDLACLKAGFRDRYLLDAIQKYANGELAIPENCDYEKAKGILKTVKGVGEKVANCILLFGLGFYEAFPIDVWMERVIRERYLLTPKQGAEFASRNFGAYAGYAQQYLFYYEKSVKKL